MKMRAALVLVVPLALCSPGTAFGQTPAVLQGLPCVGGRIAHDDVIAALLAAAGVPMRGEVLSAFADGRLGTEVIAWRNSTDEQRSLPAWNLTDTTRELLGVGSGRPASPSIVVESTAPIDLDRRLLNRRAAEYVEFRCETREPRPTLTAPWNESLVITSVDDAGKTEELGDRPFATFSYLDNQETGDQSGSADVYLGFSRRIWLDGRVGPSLSYQRTTGAEPQNDLTFALEGGSGRFRWSAGYETDDQFESAAYRADFAYEPFTGPNVCAREWTAADGDGRPNRGGRCDLWVVGDYVDVADIGAKDGLADRREFARLGLQASANWWVRTGADAYWRISGTYTLMATIAGDDGDANLGKVSIEYLPSEESRYSLGIVYERGEDLTSFAPVDQIKFTLGIRR